MSTYAGVMVTSKVAPPTNQRPLDTNLSLTLMQPLTETNMHTWKMSSRISFDWNNYSHLQDIRKEFLVYFAFQFYKALLVDKWFSKSPIEVNYWSVNRGFAHRGASCICTWLGWVDRLNCQTVFKHTLSVSDLCFRLVLVFKQSLSVSRLVPSLCQPPTLLVEGSLRHMLDEHTFAQSIWTTNRPLVLMCTPVLLNSLLPGKHTS